MATVVRQLQALFVSATPRTHTNRKAHTDMQTFSSMLAHMSIKLTFRKKNINKTRDKRAGYWAKVFKGNFWQNSRWVKIKRQENERVETDKQESIILSLPLFVCLCVCVALAFMFMTMSTVNSSREITLSFLYDQVSCMCVHVCVLSCWLKKHLVFLKQQKDQGSFVQSWHNPPTNTLKAHY